MIILERSHHTTLIDRCLAEEDGAWDELYREFHDELLNAIRTFTVRYNNPELIDEIAARVWYSLTKSDFALLHRFDTSRGASFSAYLSGIAANEFSTYLRTERRRRTREEIVGKISLKRSATPPPEAEDLDEFLAVLTDREREFFLTHLVSGKGQAGDHEPPTGEANGGSASAADADASGDSDGETLSPVNIRQLRHRVRRKLTRYMSEDE